MIATITEVKPLDDGRYHYVTDGKSQAGGVLTFKSKTQYEVGRMCEIALSIFTNDKGEKFNYYKFVRYTDDAPTSPSRTAPPVDRDAHIALQVAMKEIGELVRMQVSYPKGTETLLPPEIREAYFKWLKDTVIK